MCNNLENREYWKIRCTWFFRVDPYLPKMTMTFLFTYGSTYTHHICCPRADLHTGKVWCESVYKFWSYRPKCDFVRMAQIKWKRKRIIATSVAFLSSCRYYWLHLTPCCHPSPAILPQTWWQTDCRQTEWLGQKRTGNTFFQRYKKSSNSLKTWQKYRCFCIINCSLFWLLIQELWSFVLRPRKVCVHDCG